MKCTGATLLKTLFLITLVAVCILAFVPLSSAQEPGEQGKSALDTNMQDIRFSFDSTEITNPDALQHNAEWLRDHPNVRFVIAAFTDPVGDIPYNLLLSGQRADAVKKALVESGVEPSRIEFATGWGKLYQSCDQDTDECHEANRRAKIIGLTEVVAVAAQE